MLHFRFHLMRNIINRLSNYINKLREQLNHHSITYFFSISIEFFFSLYKEKYHQTFTTLINYIMIRYLLTFINIQLPAIKLNID